MIAAWLRSSIGLGPTAAIYFLLVLADPLPFDRRLIEGIILQNARANRIELFGVRWDGSHGPISVDRLHKALQVFILPHSLSYPPVSYLLLDYRKY